MKRAWARRNVIPLFFAFGVVGYPLISFLPDVLHVDSRVVTVPFRAIYLALSIAVTGLLLRKPKGRRSALLFWWPLSVFWSLYTVRMAVDTFISPVPLGRPASEFFLYGLGTCLLPMIAFFNYMDPVIAKRACVVTLSVAALGCVAGLFNNYQLLGGSFGRAFGNTSLNPISFGHLAASLIILCAFLLLQPTASLFLKAVVAIVIPVGLLCLGLASSRGPVLALTIVLLVLVWTTYRHRQRGRALALVGVIALGIPFAAKKISDLGGNIVARIDNTAASVEDGSAERLVLWRGAWQEFARSPLTGGGLEVRSERTYPHNVLLESYMATGVVGGVMFTILLIVGLRAAVSLTTGEPAYSWIGLLCIQNVIWAMLSGSLYARSEMWYLLAAVIGVSFSMRNIEDVRRAKRTRGRFSDVFPERVPSAAMLEA